MLKNIGIVKNYGMRKLLLTGVVLCCITGAVSAQASLSAKHPPGQVKTEDTKPVKEPDWLTSSKNGPQGDVGYRKKWTKDPFDRQIFVENQGQFYKEIDTTCKVLYQAILGDVKAYFTPEGVVYKYDKYPKNIEKKSKDGDENDEDIKPETSYSSYRWLGSNPNVTVEAKEEQSYYYTYAGANNATIKVNIFKKLVYHNIYPGIDVEYSFIQGKPGIEYSFIVHPGADISQIKISYNGISAMQVNANGDVVINTKVGEITDHAPVSYYQTSGEHIKSNFVVHSNIESFSAETINNSTDNLIIDPWTTDPLFTGGYDKAYDIDYDNAGNVYAYGSYNPFQLTKFNAAGVQQWTYNASTLSITYYGDFAVDKVTGTCYLTEGFNFAGANAVKVNTLGTFIAQFPGAASMREMWRATYNSCTRQVVIGGGGTNSPNTQAAMLDTNMTNIIPVNPLGATDCCHDVCLIAMDPTGSTAWMAVAMTFGSPSFNNIIMSLPVPALSPATYIVPDGFTFQEVGSVSYVAAGTGAANGMNGMAASPNWLYTYDGATLNKVNKGSGAIVASKAVTATSFSWGGLDADGCDNAYVGENSAVQVYSPALALTNTIPLTNTVYDVVLGANYTTLYAGGQSFVSSITLTAASSVTITNAETPTTCSGCTGTATPTLKICGAAPNPAPTYLWNPTGQTTQTATGLCAGTYTVTMTLGCGEVFTDTLTVPAGTSGGLTITKTQANEKCFGNTNATATATVTGGTGPYTYSWAPSGGNSSTSTPLGIGTYTLTVTDNSCHSDTAIFHITEPAQLRDSISVTSNVKCFGGNTGSLTVGVKGGTVPYTYLWNSTPTQNTVTAGTLTAGAYTVTVTDKNGCTVTANGTIIQPSAVRDSLVSSTPVSCPGSNNGTATVGAKDGTPGYTYLWNSTPTQATAAATGLPAGSYTCTITDANGCTSKVPVTIATNSTMRDSIVSTVNELCFGNSTGTATSGVKDGTTPYTYSWSTAPKQTTPTATGLSAGTYTVTITDANTCTVTAVATITQPSAVRDSISKSSAVLCNGGSTGTATVGAKDGTPGYSYLWNSTPTQNTVTATGLAAGAYICTVTDANGCVSTVPVTITQPAALTIKAAAFPAQCFGQCNGNAAVIPTGGTTPYHYLWNTTPTSSNASVTNLCTGVYQVTVTDANGCVIDSTPLNVTSPPAITITKNPVVSAHCGQSDGSGEITAAGGAAPYKYLWSNSTSSTTANLNNVPPGSYCVTVTDANGCTDTACINIPDTPGLTVSITATTNELCNGGNNGTATATVVGNVGSFTYLWTPTGQATQTATGLTTGPCTVTVTDSVGCSATAVATITEPPIVISNITPPATICIGQSATVTVTTTGGTPPYTYQWNNGDSTSTIVVSPLVSTNYTVITTDANGCIGIPSATVAVTVNPALTIAAATPVYICPGGTATISAAGGGGDGIYTFTWQPGNMTGQSVNVSPVANTTYTVTVHDNCGTPTDSTTVVVMLDPLPTVLFKADTTNGCYPLCINFTDESTVLGGIQSWAWTFGDGAISTSQNPNYCYDSAGVYTVGLTVKSDSGCSASLSVPNMITVYSHPVAAFTASPQPASTFNPTVNFTNLSTDVYGIRSYLWEFNEPPYDGVSTAKDTSYPYKDSGTFCPTLYVTNIHGCVDSVTHCIIIEPYFTLYIPNAFSPNGDGLNDVFSPKGTYVCSYQMYIFDRWGMLLYYTEDMNKGWDGTVNGGSNIAQEDTYIYLIEAVDCVTHDKHRYLGKVTIVK